MFYVEREDGTLLWSRSYERLKARILGTEDACRLIQWADMEDCS